MFSYPLKSVDKQSPTPKMRSSSTVECILHEFTAMASATNRMPSGEQFACALARENYNKNRYPDVLPYDATRVELSTGEYINASYIVQGPSRDLRYIAAQAPLPNTFNEFWLMVWEAQVAVIVMLTKFLERRKIKAHCYWPCDFGEQELFGDISVQLISMHSEDDGNIVMRSFRLRHNVTGETRTTMHVHYTEWPDFGVPRATGTIRKVLNIIDSHNGSGSPILVHCSAGIGRAGTLISIHAFLSRYSRGEAVLTIRQVVEELRQYRPGMVQTKEQYYFIYQAIDDILLDHPRPERSFSSNGISPRQALRGPKFNPSILTASESAIHHPIDPAMSVVSCV